MWCFNASWGLKGLTSSSLFGKQGEAQQMVNVLLWYVLPCKHKTFLQRLSNVLDIGPILYKCYTNVLCLLGDATVMSMYIISSLFSSLLGTEST